MNSKLLNIFEKTSKSVRSDNAWKNDLRSRLLVTFVVEERKQAKVFSLPSFEPIQYAVIAVSILLIIFTSTGFVSQKSLPGDKLYRVKRLIENTRLWSETDADVKNKLEEEFLEKRLDELEASLEIGSDYNQDQAVYETSRSLADIINNLPEGEYGNTVEIANQKLNVLETIYQGTPKAQKIYQIKKILLDIQSNENDQIYLYNSNPGVTGATGIGSVPNPTPTSLAETSSNQESEDGDGDNNEEGKEAINSSTPVPTLVLTPKPTLKSINLQNLQSASVSAFP